MALDRWIALVILGISLAYGYAAWFTMDASLPPFMQRNPIWPSTFPKVLAVLAILTSAVIVLGLEKGDPGEQKTPDIDYRRLTDYHLGKALGLLGLMVLYALALRPRALSLRPSASSRWARCCWANANSTSLSPLPLWPPVSSGIWSRACWGFSCGPGRFSWAERRRLIPC